MEPRCDEADRAVAVSVTGSERVRRDDFCDSFRRVVPMDVTGYVCVYSIYLLYYMSIHRVAKHIRNGYYGESRHSPTPRLVLRPFSYEPSTEYRGPYAVPTPAYRAIPAARRPATRARRPTPPRARSVVGRIRRSAAPPALAGGATGRSVRAHRHPAIQPRLHRPAVHRASRAEGRSAKGEGAATTHRSIRAPKARAPQGGFNPAGLKLRKPEET